MKNMFEYPVVPAVLLSVLLLGGGCYFFRTRSPFIAVCQWLWALLLLGLCAVDLFMEEKAWPGLGTVCVVGVCEALFLVSWLAASSRNRNGSNAGPR